MAPLFLPFRSVCLLFPLSPRSPAWSFLSRGEWEQQDLFLIRGNVCAFSANEAAVGGLPRVLSIRLRKFPSIPICLIVSVVQRCPVFVNCFLLHQLMWFAWVRSFSPLVRWVGGQIFQYCTSLAFLEFLGGDVDFLLYRATFYLVIFHEDIRIYIPERKWCIVLFFLFGPVFASGNRWHSFHKMNWRTFLPLLYFQKYWVELELIFFVIW